MPSPKRPLSPHLQIYRWQWTMVYSILHRATGIVVSLGFVFLAMWLLALASGETYFSTIHGLLSTFFGQLFLFGWSWAIFYHLGNGIRHIIWDSGYWLDLKYAEYSGHITMVASFILTLLAWFIAYV